MKKNIIFFSFILMVIILSFDCNLSDSESVPPPAAYFLVNASPDAPNMDIYDNGGVVANSLTYGNDTGYIFVSPGTHEFKVTPTGTSSFVIDAITSLDAKKYYSIFTVDSLNKIEPSIVQDNFIDTAGSTVQLRFFQLSPDAPNLDAQFTNDVDTLNFSGRNFNDQSNTNSQFTTFVIVPPGNYELKVKLPGSTAAFDSFPGISLTAGKAYTVYLKGFYNGTGAQVLDKGILEHLY